MPPLFADMMSLSDPCISDTNRKRAVLSPSSTPRILLSGTRGIERLTQY